MRLLLNASWSRYVLGADWASSDEELDEFFRLVRPTSLKRMIRVGSNADGGYVLPDDLDGIKYCISPGVSTEAGFDLEVADRGMTVIMADASVAGPPLEHPNFVFYKKFVDVFEDGSNTRLETLCKDAAAEGSDMLLQMDIEGAEERVLLDTPSEFLSKFRIMTIEFHRFQRLFVRRDLFLINRLFRKLLVTHEIVHIHQNNNLGDIKRGKYVVPYTIEMTFLRRGRAKAEDHTPFIAPHPLDRDNMSNKPSTVLGDCWWK